MSSHFLHVQGNQSPFLYVTWHGSSITRALILFDFSAKQRFSSAALFLLFCNRCFIKCISSYGSKFCLNATFVQSVKFSKSSLWNITFTCRRQKCNSSLIIKHAILFLMAKSVSSLFQNLTRILSFESCSNKPKIRLKCDTE